MVLRYGSVDVGSVVEFFDVLVRRRIVNDVKDLIVSMLKTKLKYWQLVAT